MQALQPQQFSASQTDLLPSASEKSVFAMAWNGEGEKSAKEIQTTPKVMCPSANFNVRGVK